MTDERQTQTAPAPSTDSTAAGDDAAQSADTATAVAEAPPQDVAPADGESPTAGSDEPGSATADAEAAADDGKAGAEAEEKAEAESAPAQAEDDAEAKHEAGTAAQGEAKGETEGGKKAAADEEKGEEKTEKKAEKKAEKKDAKKEAKEAKKAEKAEKAELDDPTLRELRAAKEKGERVSGKVIGWNQGGFHVVIDEVTAFCPASEMELGRPRSPNTYLDREMEFKVVKFQRRGRRVVLSRSEVLAKERESILEELQPGKVVTGIVTSLPDFGAFVDLGGVEGLVHVSEISRSRVQHPRDVLEMGQQVEVKVLKVEEGGDRISLSMKELEPDPWDGVAERYPRGTRFTGKVLRKADFGLFVELEPDVEGLIHVSQLAPGQSLDSEDIQPGNTVEGWVRDVEPKRQRISLSLREVPSEDPWKTVTERFPEGEMVEGTVESIAPFGVFINLAPGLTGLLPNSQTGLPRGSNLSRAFHPGQTVQVAVLSIDTRRKRISLGKEGSRAEATKADLKAFKQEQKQREQEAQGAMAAALAGLKDQLDLPEADDEG